jgi:hypothetical protein
MPILSDEQFDLIVEGLATYGFQISDDRRYQAKLLLELALLGYETSFDVPKNITTIRHLAQASRAAKTLHRHLEAAEDARSKALPFAIAGHGIPWWLEKIEALIEVTDDLAEHKSKKIKEGPGAFKHLVGVDLADLFEHLTDTPPGYSKIDCEEEQDGRLRDVTKVGGPYIDFCEQVLREARITTPKGVPYDRDTLARYFTEMREIRAGGTNSIIRNLCPLETA